MDAGVTVLNFTAIDFETANAYRGSPCAVGLIRFRDGEPVDEQRWLIRPPEPLDYFSAFNVSLHGIDAEMVRHAPRWSVTLPAIVEYISDDVVVAHNAGFDIGVIRYACAVDNIEWPHMRFLCTLVLARRAIRLPSYRLPFVTHACGFDMVDHHDPLADARAVGGIIATLAQDAGVTDLTSLAAAHHVCIGQISNGTYEGSVSTASGGNRASSGNRASGGGALVRPKVTPDADPDGYLYNRVVVFTGSLMSMTRQMGWDECARLGALPENTPTKRTHVLVVGGINPAVLRTDSHLTGKTRRAFELQDKGQNIEVMTEDDFLRCLDGKPLKNIPELTGVLSHPASLQPTIQPRLDRFRSLPLAERTKPTPHKPPGPPKPLRREPVPTDQLCSTTDCTKNGAFKTYKNPTYCETHISTILREGGLGMLESFTHPKDWLLTQCLKCDNVAHYRFVYVQEKNTRLEPTCRACYLREWALDQRGEIEPYGDNQPTSYEEAEAIAENHGYIYLGQLTNPSMAHDPHRVECCRCGTISAARLSDISFGCTCQPRT